MVACVARILHACGVVKRVEVLVEPCTLAAIKNRLEAAGSLGLTASEVMSVSPEAEPPPRERLLAAVAAGYCRAVFMTVSFKKIF